MDTSVVGSLVVGHQCFHSNWSLDLPLSRGNWRPEPMEGHNPNCCPCQTADMRANFEKPGENSGGYSDCLV